MKKILCCAIVLLSLNQLVMAQSVKSKEFKAKTEHVEEDAFQKQVVRYISLMNYPKEFSMEDYVGMVKTRNTIEWYRLKGSSFYSAFEWGFDQKIKKLAIEKLEMKALGEEGYHSEKHRLYLGGKPDPASTYTVD